MSAIVAPKQKKKKNIEPVKTIMLMQLISFLFPTFTSTYIQLIKFLPSCNNLC